MRVTIGIQSEADAVKAEKSLRTLLPAGKQDARFVEAEERPAKSGKDMIAVGLAVIDADGQERVLRDYFTDSAACAVRFRHAAAAVGALERFEAGEISASDFVGHACRIQIGVEKKRGYNPRNVVLDYSAAAASGVVNLRAG
jgi:hypothetical protein